MAQVETSGTATDGRDGISGPPLFRAVANATRPMHQLLRCINFSHKVHVQLSEDGIRFMADTSRVMQGIAFLDKSLFASYAINLPAVSDGDSETADLPNFQIALPALLETLQILGTIDVASRAQKAEHDPYRSNIRNYRPDAFSHQALGISGTCCLLYSEPGAPFSIIIEESGVKTTANLVTYVPDIPEEIPFDRNDISLKIIMQSRHLLDSMAELAVMAPEKLVITVSHASPYLEFSSRGELGKSSMDFSRGKQELLETFWIQGKRWVQSYKFDLIRTATEAMRIASKVAFRGDCQGVLSWNFLVDLEGAVGGGGGGGGKSSLSFIFVPYARNFGDDDDGEDGTDGDDRGGDEQASNAGK